MEDPGSNPVVSSLAKPNSPGIAIAALEIVEHLFVVLFHNTLLLLQKKSKRDHTQYTKIQKTYRAFLLDLRYTFTAENSLPLFIIIPLQSSRTSPSSSVSCVPLAVRSRRGC